jgi:hypothetical protein
VNELACVGVADEATACTMGEGAGDMGDDTTTGAVEAESEAEAEAEAETEAVVAYDDEALVGDADGDTDGESDGEAVVSSLRLALSILLDTSVNTCTHSCMSVSVSARSRTVSSRVKIEK